MAEIEYKLTTVDNPYDPFTQFDEWYSFDLQQGYYTCSYLDRIVSLHTNKFEKLSENEQIEVINDAIDEIVRLNTLGIYKKVSRKTTETS